LKTSQFDIYVESGGNNKAIVLEYQNITPRNGVITVTITPRPNRLGDYHAAINGVEIVKP